MSLPWGKPPTPPQCPRPTTVRPPLCRPGLLPWIRSSRRHPRCRTSDLRGVRVVRTVHRRKAPGTLPPANRPFPAPLSRRRRSRHPQHFRRRQHQPWARCLRPLHPHHRQQQQHQRHQLPRQRRLPPPLRLQPPRLRRRHRLQRRRHPAAHQRPADHQHPANHRHPAAHHSPAPRRRSRQPRMRPRPQHPAPPPSPARPPAMKQIRTTAPWPSSRTATLPQS